MKYVPYRLLSKAGHGRLGVESLPGVENSVPSYCPVCGRQRIHYVVCFAKHNGRSLVKLECEHEVRSRLHMVG